MGGGAARYAAQTITRAQVGKFGVGTNKAYRKLLLKAGRRTGINC